MSATAPPRKVYDVLTTRRLVVTALLVLAAVLTVKGFQAVKDQRAANCQAPAASASVVRQLFPCPGDSDLRQGRIGADLATGYTGQISIDKVPIPQDQLTVEGSNVWFTPGPGTETGALAPGTHCAQLDYYKLAQDPSQGTTYGWCLSTH